MDRVAGGLETQQLTASVGAEVLGVDADRLLEDQALPGLVMDALGEHGVLVFRGLDLDDRAQVAFGNRLGVVAAEEVVEISQAPENPLASALRGIVEWHMDGTTRSASPDRATMLTAKVVAPQGGQTQFAGTYAAYDALTGAEARRYGGLRVVHSFAASQRSTHPDPSPEELADWDRRGSFEFPLVWTHRSGRRSLVIGSSAERVVGMTDDEGRAVLDDLLERTTAPGRVYTHEWEVGDLVMWDNPGILHRVLAYDARSGRRMHRTSLVGDEPIR